MHHGHHNETGGQKLQKRHIADLAGQTAKGQRKDRIKQQGRNDRCDDGLQVDLEKPIDFPFDQGGQANAVYDADFTRL